jgi:hypothetical protein
MSVHMHIAILGAGPGEDVAAIRAHPPLAEGFMEAAEDAEGKAIHQVRKKVG